MMKRKAKTVSHRAAMAKEMRDPEFRYHYEQRKLVQEMAIVVRNLRASHRLTQGELAKRVGVSQPMIARVERGIGQKQPNWQLLHRIIVALRAQMKLSFMSDISGDEPLVELNGKPLEVLAQPLL